MYDLQILAKSLNIVIQFKKRNANFDVKNCCDKQNIMFKKRLFQIQFDKLQTFVVYFWS